MKIKYGHAILFVVTRVQLSSSVLARLIEIYFYIIFIFQSNDLLLNIFLLSQKLIFFEQTEDGKGKESKANKAKFVTLNLLTTKYKERPESFISPVSVNVNFMIYM